MSKRDRQQAPETLLRWQKAGKGQGVGKTYRPWLTIQDFAGPTKCSRIKGWKTGRSHDLLSPLELEVFFLLDWDETVTDIREQFPVPLEESIRLAKDLRILHPKSKTGNPYTLTTTFLVNRGDVVTAVEIAYTNQKRASGQKIREAYWNQLHIPVIFLSEKTINRTEARNIEWIHPYRDEVPSLPEDECFAAIQAAKSLKAACTLLDNRHRNGAAVQSIRCFLAQRIWEIDMTLPIDWSQKLSIINRNARQEFHYRVA